VSVRVSGEVGDLDAGPGRSYCRWPAAKNVIGPAPRSALPTAARPRAIASARTTQRQYSGAKGIRSAKTHRDQLARRRRVKSLHQVSCMLAARPAAAAASSSIAPRRPGGSNNMINFETYGIGGTEGLVRAVRPRRACILRAAAKRLASRRRLRHPYIRHRATLEPPASAQVRTLKRENPQATVLSLPKTSNREPSQEDEPADCDW
jgi:hypothetical protein